MPEGDVLLHNVVVDLDALHLVGLHVGGQDVRRRGVVELVADPVHVRVVDAVEAAPAARPHAHVRTDARRRDVRGAQAGCCRSEFIPTVNL